MKKYLYITGLFFCLFCIEGFAQQRKIDSLTNLLKSNINEDTNKVQVLYKLCFLLKETKTKEALNYGNQALRLAESLNYKKGIGSSYNNLGSLYDAIGKREEAIDYFFKAYEIKKELNDIRGLSTTLNNLGVIYKRDQDYKKALEYYHLSRSYSQKTNNAEQLISVNQNFGALFNEMHNVDSAIYYLNLAKIQSKNNAKTLVEIYSSLSNVYSNSKYPEKCILYADTGLVILNKLEIKNSFNFFSLHKATAYENMGLLDSASKYYEDYKSKLKDTTEYEKIQQLYYRLANFNYKLFKSNKDIGALEKAFLYNKISFRNRTLAFNLQKSKLLSNIKRQIEVQGLESEIENAKKEQEISNLKSTKQQLIIYTIAFVLLLLVIFSVLLYKRFKITNKQKEIIAEKNKNIIDSLRYAKRIQTSLLPTEKYIERVLNAKDKNT